MTDPTVSVVIPAYNGAALIEETLASLSAQTLPDWEAIVVDDVSSDATRAVVAAWPDARVRLLCNEVNAGPVHTRNRGVAAARGRYVAGLDQDDLCLPERLARQVGYLDTHPDVALLGTQAHYLRDGVVGPSSYAPVTTPALIAWLMRIENPLVWSSVMVRGKVARALDPFTRPEILYAEDFDLYHRVQAHGRIARLDEPLLLYRQHAGGASQRFTETMRASAAAVLVEAQRRLFGEAADRIAALIVRHVMGGDPVPDRATLAALGAAIGRLQHDHLARHPLSADDRKLIRWETAQRWGRVGRAALRAGTLSLGDLLAVRPAHLGLGYQQLHELLVGSAIGHGRRWCRTG
jgi:glycosyltransferase involved in cell wall biosynthesis